MSVLHSSEVMRRLGLPEAEVVDTKVMFDIEQDVLAFRNRLESEKLIVVRE